MSGNPCATPVQSCCPWNTGIPVSAALLWENTKVHVLATYRYAVELFAHLCQQFGSDPMADGVIISHSEGCRRGIASNHGDVEHLLMYTMFENGNSSDRFTRNAVLELLRTAFRNVLQSSAMLLQCYNI